MAASGILVPYNVYKVLLLDIKKHAHLSAQTGNAILL